VKNKRGRFFDTDPQFRETESMNAFRWIGALSFLLVSLAGCEKGPKLMQAEALAGSLPLNEGPQVEQEIRPHVSAFSPESSQSPLKDTWALYRTIYCAEKGGDPFLVDETLSAAGESRGSWSLRLDELAEDIRDGEADMAQTWVRISETPCPSLHTN